MKASKIDSMSNTELKTYLRNIFRGKGLSAEIQALSKDEALEVAKAETWKVNGKKITPEEFDKSYVAKRGRPAGSTNGKKNESKTEKESIVKKESTKKAKAQDEEEEDSDVTELSEGMRVQSDATKRIYELVEEKGGKFSLKSEITGELSKPFSPEFIAQKYSLLPADDIDEEEEEAEENEEEVTSGLSAADVIKIVREEIQTVLAHLLKEVCKPAK